MVDLESAELAALQWVRSLKPQRRIEVFEGQAKGKTLYVYQPSSQEWEKLK